MLNLPGPLKGLAADPRPQSQFLWLWEIEVSTGVPPTPTLVIRLVNHDALVELDPVRIFYPFPIAQSELEQTQEGDLPQMTLGIDNRRRWLSPFLDASDGFLDRPATVWLVNRDAVSEANSWKQTFRVAGAEEGSDSVVFRLEMPNFLLERIPADRFNAQKCDWDFGGPECGYIVNAAAAYTTCPKTLTACIARGEDERVRRIPVLHPRRYGAFRGIPVRR